MLGLYEPGSRVDLSIEGMHSQRFGVGVFFLLILGILLFSGLIVAVFRGSGDQRVTRTGEKWMLQWCLLRCKCCRAYSSDSRWLGRRVNYGFSRIAR